MYTFELFKKGIEFLRIREPESFISILQSNDENLKYIEDIKKKEKLLLEWNNRYVVPYGLTKKKYGEMKKEVSLELQEIKELIHQDPYDEYAKMIQEDYLEMKVKLQRALKNKPPKKGEKLDIPSAKEYPIEMLIEFNGAGKALCPWHDEKTPSLSWDRKRNKAHCFAGCGDFDSIDLYMKINKTNLPTAVKALCQK